MSMVLYHGEPNGPSLAVLAALAESGLAIECRRIDLAAGERHALDLAQSVARSLEPYNLAWYEEPVAPERTEETIEIRRSIRQPMAGGELLFLTKGFSQLCRTHAVHVIMPDVKHCGGLLELTHIAALAAMEGVAVAPHNPSGPVSTAASGHVCAALPNFRVLELQWGEVPWRGEVVTPAEIFENGHLAVSDRPGFGVALNESLVKKFAL